MTTTSAVLPAPIQQKFSAKLLSTPQARLIHKIGATPYRMTDRSGYILRMRRYTRLETAPVPVNPAMMNPPSQLLTAVDIDARLDWYATYTIITKEVTLQNQDPKRQYGVSKSPLIDLEVLQQDDKAEDTHRRKRLNEENS
jgi:hypothetical protein